MCVTSTLLPINESTFFLPKNSTICAECKWTALNSIITSFLLLSLLLNTGAAFVVFRVPLVSKSGKSNPLHLCIRFLNAVDLIQSLILLLMPLFANVDCEWFGGKPVCKMCGFVALFLLLVSPLVTIMMALDRVMALFQPFKYRSNLGFQTLKLLLPVFCGITLLICALPLAGVGEYHVVKGRRMCLLDTITDDPVDNIYVVAVHSLFLIALFVMVGCTVTFQVKLLNLSEQRKTTLSQSVKSSRARQTRNATVTTMAVCLIFVACYGPYVIRVIVEASSGVKSNVWFTQGSFVLAFLQPMLNPVVCLCANAKYRAEMRVIFRRVKGVDFGTSSDSVTPNSRAHSIDIRKRQQPFGDVKTKQKQTLRQNVSTSSSYHAGVNTKDQASLCANALPKIPDQEITLLLE